MMTNSPIPPETQHEFDYFSLDESVSAQIKTCANEIHQRIRQSAQAVIDIGERLAHVRDLLRHNKRGGFQQWLTAEFGWSKTTAYQFIQVFEAFRNCPPVGQLPIEQAALYKLAASSTPDEVRQDAIARATHGERITAQKAREMISEVQHLPEQSLEHTSPEAVANEEFGVLLDLPQPDAHTASLCFAAQTADAAHAAAAMLAAIPGIQLSQPEPSEQHPEIWLCRASLDIPTTDESTSQPEKSKGGRPPDHEKRERVRQILAAYPKYSTAQVADEAGVSTPFVRRIKRMQRDENNIQ
jgi:hypothetical protein